MYAELDKITDEDASARMTDRMDRIWNKLNKAQQAQVIAARKLEHPVIGSSA